MRKKIASWSKLDNAAKIFPSTSNKRDTKVFRFACELYDQIDPAVLQQALDQTVVDFPVYQSVIKKGLFWYYFESSTIKPIVKEEKNPPCSPLYIHNRKNLLFEVTYYNKRINLEVYHALSDGTGALQFLRSLVYHYITNLHPKKFENENSLFDYDASCAQKMDDSFKKYYSNGNKKLKEKMKVAYKIKQPKLSENRISVIEGVMPLDQMLKLAHDKNTTLTVLLASIFLCSINREMAVRDRKYPISLVVPVNLRKYFFSETVRNFFSVISVRYDFKNYDEDFDIVLKHISECLKDELKVEQLSLRMNSLSALENNIFARPVPLFIKDVIMKIANFLSEKERTASISNVGKINMPDELKPYVRLFDVFVSTNIIQICMCSFNNNLTVTFSSAYSSTEIQKHFFRCLTEMGIPIEVNSNQINVE